MSKLVRKIILSSLLCFLAFAMVIYFGLVSRTSNLLKTEQSLMKKQVSLKKVEDKATTLQKLGENPTELDKIKKATDDLWPEKDEVSAFIVQLESLANQKGVVLNSLSINETPAPAVKAKESENNDTTTKDDSESSSATPAKKDRGSSGILFAFDTSGSYETVREFLNSLEKIPRFNVISQLSLNSTNNNVSLKIVGYIYAK